MPNKSEAQEYFFIPSRLIVFEPESKQTQFMTSLYSSSMVCYWMSEILFSFSGTALLEGFDRAGGFGIDGGFFKVFFFVRRVGGFFLKDADRLRESGLSALFTDPLALPGRDFKLVTDL